MKPFCLVYNQSLIDSHKFQLNLFRNQLILSLISESKEVVSYEIVGGIRD